MNTPIDKSQIDNEKLMTVCSACFQASCWHGEFMCDEAKTAGTVELSLKELKKLDLEHPDYWNQ